MPSINKHIVVGNVGQEPEIRYSGDGKAIVTFSVATTTAWKDKESGEKKERTEWHTVVTFNKLADICAEYITQGRQVYVEGESRHETFDKDGVTHYRTKLYADDIQFLGSKPTAAVA